jgi:hypothetical protein
VQQPRLKQPVALVQTKTKLRPHGTDNSFAGVVALGDHPNPGLEHYSGTSDMMPFELAEAMTESQQLF